MQKAQLNMQLTHIRRSDLNLLPALVVLLEECSISRAAARHNLSQPAMSRILQRLRGMFRDELLVRTPKGYQLTERALALQAELPTLLQGIDRQLRGKTFDPAAAQEDFRLCCSDFIANLFMPHLAGSMSRLAPRSRLEILTWHESAFEDVARGSIDVVIWANRAPPPLQSEQILGTRMVCVLAPGHALGKKRLTLERYLVHPQVDVTVLKNKPTIVDVQLNTAGHRRNIALRVPYFGAAIVAVERTDLIATLPEIAVRQYTGERNVRILPPPFDFKPIQVLMSWHPSKTSEPALRWFRELLRTTATQIAADQARRAG
jgi:DNA-binding transcriptional LysR family regulator